VVHSVRKSSPNSSGTIGGFRVLKRIVSWESSIIQLQLDRNSDIFNFMSCKLFELVNFNCCYYTVVYS